MSERKPVSASVLQQHLQICRIGVPLTVESTRHDLNRADLGDAEQTAERDSNPQWL